MNSGELARLYLEDKKCPREMSEMFGLSLSTIRRALIAAGVQMRSVREATLMTRPAVAAKYRGKPRIDAAMRERLNSGKRDWSKRLGLRTRISKNGYVEICTRLCTDYGRSVHVVLMEHYIARRLKKGEVVHHIDGDKQNNALSNLRLMTLATHAALHRKQEKEQKK